ncbi:lema family protein [Variovorax sp. YR216]|uniref:lema family protein n=1 Tax=Variovorax sp. YR216 TaxID=1882828 RepID=UPI00210A3039|nr:lema family protein [Variovorax sp. YR216]
MPESLPYWIAGAIALFWFVGAYNRLMRLRSAALQAYAVLDAALVRQLDFVLARVAEEEPSATPLESPSASVRAAANQLSTLLAATRLRPLNPAGMAAMSTAMHVMLAAWQRLHPDAVVSFDADGTLSRPASLEGHGEGAEVSIPIAWPEPSAAAEMARAQFNLAVTQYNAAIADFPAVLVAWIMQLKAAAPLR